MPASEVQALEQVRRLVTEIPGPRSAALQRRRAEAVSAGVATVLPVFIERAHGAILLDVDGNQLIDFGSGIAVMGVGHGEASVLEAVRSQVEAFTHTCFMVTPYEGYVAVAERLGELTPGDHPKRSMLVNSGAEAVENAVKIARYVTGRQAVVVFENAYHGRTNLTMALTHKSHPYKDGFGPFAGEVYRMPMADPFRWPTGRERAGTEALERFAEALHVEVGEERVACVVLEPIQGEGGFVVPPPGFVAGVAELCRAHGILFVADEIQTGLCRTGDWFASEHEGVVPDLVTTAKALAGGLPLGAVTGRAEIMDAVRPGGLGGTFGGNPVATAAALATLATMAEGDFCRRARTIDTVMRPRLEALAETYPCIGEVRGRGAMLAIELVVPGTTKPDAALAAKVAQAAHRRGLVVLTAGTRGNVLRFLPPLVIEPALLSDGLDILEEAFGECASGHVGPERSL